MIGSSPEMADCSFSLMTTSRIPSTGGSSYFSLIISHQCSHHYHFPIYRYPCHTLSPTAAASVPIQLVCDVESRKSSAIWLFVEML